MDKNLLLGSIPITEQVETLLRISKEHNPTFRSDPYQQMRENLITKICYIPSRKHTLCISDTRMLGNFEACTRKLK